MKKNIALVAGGYSGEYVVSLKSAETIYNNLDKNKYNVYKVIITKEGWTYTTAAGNAVEIDKNDFSLTIDGQKITFEAVYMTIHGTPGEDGLLQGYFEMLNIPITCCGLVASALTFNKSYCNKIVATLGTSMQVAKSAHVFRDQPYDVASILQDLTLPLFVKPAEGGSSIGMSKVKEASELPAAIEKAFKEDKQVLIEEFIVGREFTCGAYTSNGEVIVLPITEVIFTREFFDFEAKYTPGLTKEVTPAEIPAPTTATAQAAIAQIYKALNCKGVVRIDFIWNEAANKLYFLEANTTPGQSETSIIPQQVRAAGGDLTTFYGALIEECLRK
ncbi:D-alanine--D-alanine ligase [Chitinophaga skermanii]|nr:D-alanine--D-alanine ligase [Chitinophaga skermanii]